MTGYDAQKGDILASVDDVYQVGVTDGKALQSSVDQPALAQAAADLQGMQGERDAAVAALAAYEATHPDTPPVEPPPPVDPPVIVGMNFIHGTTLPQETQAKAARIYVPTGQTDITTLSEFKRAYALGIRDFTLSTKETSTPKWFSTVPKDVHWRYVNHHEPEDDIADGGFTLAQWKTWQATQMPAARAAGAEPWVILMAWTTDPASKRNVADYVLPKGLVDGVGFDLYPTSVKGQTASMGRIKAALTTLGVSKYLLGEYGVPTSNPTLGVQMVTALKPQVADSDVILYWSQQVNPGTTDYHFTAQTAAAWFDISGS